MKTKFDSYYVNEIAEGCKYCVRGEKLVLFVSGRCERNCFYCSLSKNRKNTEKMFVNERECKSVRECIEEAKESRAKGAGITGGDPLLCLNKTLRYAKALKNAFCNFHIHIYLPTRNVTRKKLRMLKKCVDEVRFHPEFLILGKNEREKSIDRDVEKIKIASEIFGKANVGCEMPLLPDRKREIFSFFKRVSESVGFVNLNEFEISDTNFNIVTRKYKLTDDTYTIKGSREAGLWILKQCEKARLRLKVHVCTANTKNHYQYKNRLRKHAILPYGKKTGEGTVIYFAIYAKNVNELGKIARKLRRLRHYFVDKKKNRIILSRAIVFRAMGFFRVKRVEEFPTFDGVEVEESEVEV